MPPEAILQRPSIVQHVLALLRPADKASSLPKLALQFLLCLVCRIKQALGMASNPDLVPVPSGMGCKPPSLLVPTNHPCSTVQLRRGPLHQLLHSTLHCRSWQSLVRSFWHSLLHIVVHRRHKLIKV